MASVRQSRRQTTAADGGSSCVRTQGATQRVARRADQMARNTEFSTYVALIRTGLGTRESYDSVSPDRTGFVRVPEPAI